MVQALYVEMKWVQSGMKICPLHPTTSAGEMLYCKIAISAILL
jgi:hypothetical protein